MLWNTKIKKNAQPLTAEEDIKAIMFMYIDGDDLRQAPWQILYSIDEVSPKIDVACDKYCDIFFIEDGYPSYQYGEVTLKNQTYIIHNGDDEYGWVFDCIYGNLPVKPYECVIPKGTKYYINETHEIISETIIVKEPLMFLTETNE